MKILITGANGQLGRCLQDVLRDEGYTPLNPSAPASSFQLQASSSTFYPLTRNDLDISDRDAVLRLVRELAPDVVINAAAYTAVDKAESEPDLAYKINADGPRYLAQACRDLDIPLVHVSTDYVFDGTATEPYKETDPTNPLGVYGASKLAGEQAIQQTWSKHLIVRTAWVFSEYGNNFLKTMLRLAKERDEIRVVADQVGTPTYAGDLAECILRAVNLLGEAGHKFGTFHFSGGIKETWCGFASHVFSQAEKIHLINKAPKVVPISSGDYPVAVKRPAFSVLEPAEKDGWSGDWDSGCQKALCSIKKCLD